MNAIMPRATIEQIVRYHDDALVLYERAYDAMERAEEALKAARAMARMVTPPGGINGYNFHNEEEVKRFSSALSLPPRDEYLRTARKILKIDAWAFLVERTDLERLMDVEAKAKLRAQMKYIPERPRHSREVIGQDEIDQGLPPITVENIYATLQSFMADAGNIFQRGAANTFAKLDRRFRSHDGFKIGSRIILTNVFDVRFGGLNYGTIEDKLIDVERVFCVLDDKPEASFTSALNQLRQEANRGRLGSGPQQLEVETDLFLIRGYKNGNAHLWFKRDDLVLKLNKLLADWYGEVIGDGQTKEADPFADVKHLPARYFGFFPTPDKVADLIFEGRGWRQGIPVLRAASQPQLRILEPSAGTGQLARRCVTSIKSFKDWAGYGDAERMAGWAREYRLDNLVDVVELQPHLASQLSAEGIYNRVYCEDFLRLDPATTGLYDIIVMNPPFDRERDIDHVVHALKFLKPGGQITAIVSAGTEFRTTRKAKAFQQLVADHGGEFNDLPPGSFSETGTNVNTCYVQFRTRG